MLASDLGSAERTVVHCGTRGHNHRAGKRAARHPGFEPGTSTKEESLDGRVEPS
jgi:hypothetical protein